jgi:hypothetical protein
MSAVALASLFAELLANLPTIIKTGRDLMHFLNTAYEQLFEAIKDKDVTPEELKEIVDRIVKNSIEIQSIP